MTQAPDSLPDRDRDDDEEIIIDEEEVPQYE